MKLKKKIEFIRLDLNLEIRNVHFGNDFFFFLKIKKSAADTHILTLTKKRVVKLLFKTFTNN